MSMEPHTNLGHAVSATKASLPSVGHVITTQPLTVAKVTHVNTAEHHMFGREISLVIITRYFESFCIICTDDV